MDGEVRELNCLEIKSCKVIFHILQLLQIRFLFVLLLVTLYDFVKADSAIACFVKVFEDASHLLSLLDQ